MLATRLMGATSAAAANIEYVGGYVQSFVGTTANQSVNLGGALSGGLDSSPQIGDLIIFYFGTASNTDRNLVVTDNTTGDPYTEVVELYANDSYDTNLVVSYRFSTRSGGVVNLIGGTGSGLDAGAVAVQVWRGVDTVTPLDVTETTATGVNSVLCNPPAITPVTSGAIIVAGGAGAHNAGAQTYSSSDLTEFITAGRNDTYDATIGLGYHVWTSGAFDPAAFTFSGADSTSFSWAAVTLALRPA